MTTLNDAVDDIFAAAGPVLLRKLQSGLMARYRKEFMQFVKGLERSERAEIKQNPYVLIASFLAFSISSLQKKIKRHSDLEIEYIRRFKQVATKTQERELVLEFAKRVGRSGRELRRDRRAFSRWFGFDAVVGRNRRLLGEMELEICFSFSRLGVAVSKAFISSESIQSVWRNLNIEPLVTDLLEYKGDDRVNVAAFRSFATIVKGTAESLDELEVSPASISMVYRFALDRRQNIWIQVEALELLAVLSKKDFAKASQNRILHPSKGDDLFVRARVAVLLGSGMADIPELLNLIPLMLFDPNPFVRQRLCRAVTWVMIYPPEKEQRTIAAAWLRQLMLEDDSPHVRAAMVLEIAPSLRSDTLYTFLVNLFDELLKKEKDDFVLRVALESIVSICSTYAKLSRLDQADALVRLLIPSLQLLHTHAESLKVRRWTGQTLLFLECTLDDSARELLFELAPHLRSLRSGKSVRIPHKLVQGREEKLGLVLAVSSQKHFGLTAKRCIGGYRIACGDVFGLKIWRTFYELMHPSTDKRQGHNHVIGRHFRGRIKAPSGILSEMTQTKVPGEPLFMSSEAGWRPYLPLTEDVMHALFSCSADKPLELHTAEGITRVKPSRNPLLRIRGVCKLIFGFAGYAQLRNWKEEDPSSPAKRYTLALRSLGVAVEYEPRAFTNPPDPAVMRFFPQFVPFVAPNITEAFTSYFFSVYENTLYELGLFAALLLLYFIVSRTWKAHRAKRWRKQLKIVIGGWGTRGKSGTERLKAALIEFMGYSLFSKTTGCEAMFLHSHTFGKTSEMFLFRPYDKATIWEHHETLGLASKLQADTYLWECMALTPAYVRILQHRWSRDDYSTVTNAYPDHEDIQGPAGYNIPLVISDFLPRNSKVAITEEEMLPILQERARELGSTTISKGWLEAGLLTPDILDRFPYQEHPYNIVLTLSLCSELDIPTDVALKELADRVVPDLGVLKGFPIAQYLGRRLEFINGMSANERFATINNWRRMRFHESGPEDGIFLCTLVNNRADRVSRSAMFGSILVGDVQADLHILIGTNLKGLQGYIKQALDSYIDSLSLYSTSSIEQGSIPMQKLQDEAVKQRVPVSAEALQKRLGHILRPFVDEERVEKLINLWEEPDSVRQLLEKDAENSELDITVYIAFHKRWLESYKQYQTLAERISRSGASPDINIDQDFRQTVRIWYLRRIHVIADAHATGNQVIHSIATATPPGMLTRIMGMQNIKGTGLDFVYKWQSWEQCEAACQLLQARDESDMRKGLRTLLSFHDYSLLAEQTVKDVVSQVRNRPEAQNERTQAELSIILQNLQDMMEKTHSSLETNYRPGFLHSLLTIFENLFDAGDSVRRRKRARVIYRDLANERISHQRAVQELKDLNKRQKGGWLQSMLLGS